MSLAAGDVFAGYTVMRLLGSDGMGELYLARHPRPPRQDALRVLPAWVSADGGFRARFEREADLAAALSHPHIVGMRGRGEYLGRLWIATDFVDASDAARLVRDRYPDGMPAEEVVDVVTAVADALDYAHARHLLHRNVTAASILLTSVPTRRILLADFGIPRRNGGPDDQTAANLAIGVPPVRAIDGREDQYALAVTAYFLLSGTAQYAHPPGHTRPDLAAFDPALGRALARDPSTRFDTCLGFAAALREGLAGVANTVAAPLPRAIAPLAPLDGPETGPRQPVFVPAWSEEPAPNPYLDDPYPDEPYPDPDPSHSPTMTAMAVPDPASPPPPTPPHADVEHSPGTTGRTWAMAGVAAVIVLVIVLVVVVARAGSETEAQPSTRPQFSNSQQPPPPPEPTSAPPIASVDGAERQRAQPPPVAGPDGKGDTCQDGYQITGREGWASHATRGNTAATCIFVGNVLKAYWDAADPDDAPRTVVATGAIPCSDGVQCAGDQFVVTCAVEGSDPWVTCRGGRDAVVYLY